MVDKFTLHRDAQFDRIIRRVNQILLRAEISLSGLDGMMSRGGNNARAKWVQDYDLTKATRMFACRCFAFPSAGHGYHEYASGVIPAGEALPMSPSPV